MSLLECVLAGERPSGAQTVSERLLRRVFRLGLEDGRDVFVKQHSFPVLRVRLRYLLRPSPTAREAARLREARRRGVCVPEVLAERTERGLLGPRRAVLVTTALPVLREASHAERMRAARGLAARGIEHPDLHPGNVLILAGGELAIVDFQSVRFHRAPLRDGPRLRMHAKAASAALQELDEAAFAQLLQEELSAGESEALAPLLVRLQASERASRRRHTLRSSSRFLRERARFFGTRVRLRAQPLPPQQPSEDLPPSSPAQGVVAMHWSPQVLRFSARGSLLRTLWLDGVSAGGSADLSFLAYEKDAPWPWSMTHLYIQLSRDTGEALDASACWHRLSARSTRGDG